MVLVDSSVWIEVFRKPARVQLEAVVEMDEIVTCQPVVQEVLQGFRDPRAFAIARDAMLALPTVESPMRVEVVLEAVDLYRNARTTRWSVDCLIAACALRNGLSVLHRDRDYDLLARVSSLESRAV